MEDTQDAVAGNQGQELLEAFQPFLDDLEVDMDVLLEEVEQIQVVEASWERPVGSSLEGRFLRVELPWNTRIFPAQILTKLSIEIDGLNISLRYGGGSKAPMRCGLKSL